MAVAAGVLVCNVLLTSTSVYWLAREGGWGVVMLFAFEVCGHAQARV
jgi:hypothetical protein